METLRVYLLQDGFFSKGLYIIENDNSFIGDLTGLNIAADA
jgi:hypothetical protein